MDHYHNERTTTSHKWNNPYTRHNTKCNNNHKNNPKLKAIKQQAIVAAPPHNMNKTTNNNNKSYSNNLGDTSHIATLTYSPTSN